MSNSIVVGCDIGGSHISTALVDLNENKIIPESFVRLPVDSHGDPDDIITTWCNAIQSAATNLKIEVTKIGIAMPGPLDYEKGICMIKDQDKYEQLYGLNLKELIGERLQLTVGDIAMMNDASSFLQGEMLAGAGAGFKKAIGFTLGTGLGSAIYSDHTAKDAALWNFPYREGIAEDYFSTRWFTKTFNTRTGASVMNVKEVLAQDEQRELTLELFDTFATNLADFIFSLYRKESPEVIVLGGNITKSADLFLSKTISCLSEKGCLTPIRIANLGELSAIYGAAGQFRLSEVE